MNITEVRVKRLEQRSDRLRAFCSITIDDEFVVHDLRVIEGRKGLFVAMPSRKITDNCPSCGGKNHLQAQFCCSCSEKLDKDRSRKRDKSHIDVAHPIVTSCRDKIMNAVLEAYEEECGEDSKPEDIGQPYGNGMDEEELSESEIDYDYEDDDDCGPGQDREHQKETSETDDSAKAETDGAEREENRNKNCGFGDGIL